MLHGIAQPSERFGRNTADYMQVGLCGSRNSNFVISGSSMPLYGSFVPMAKANYIPS